LTYLTVGRSVRLTSVGEYQADQKLCDGGTVSVSWTLSGVHWVVLTCSVGEPWKYTFVVCHRGRGTVCSTRNNIV